MIKTGSYGELVVKSDRTSNGRLKGWIVRGNFTFDSSVPSRYEKRLREAGARYLRDRLDWFVPDDNRVDYAKLNEMLAEATPRGRALARQRQWRLALSALTQCAVPVLKFLFVVALLLPVWPLILVLAIFGGVGGGGGVGSLPPLASGSGWKISKTGTLWVGPRGFRRPVG